MAANAAFLAQLGIHDNQMDLSAEKVNKLSTKSLAKVKSKLTESGLSMNGT